MFAPYRSNAVAYRQLGVETAMADATPHKLIVMLFDGADEHIRKGRSAMERADHAAKGEALTRAIRILDEGLRASIDARGGELAANLRDLYTYMIGRLLAGSARNEVKPLDEVLELLHKISSAWAQISPDTVSAMPAMPVRRPAQATAAAR
ncbi:MAG TPA: flagellar export chaperone FliS [Burkholderiaceae bacterium]|jgi:flagellar protein FliS|nr:flagellar export chaperone FliS [Burkholderiaceae bacterium]